MSTLPLEGVTVVELTTYVAAPVCGRMMADLGATVIKIESPEGDVWRYLRRNIAYTENGTVNAMFEMSNAGKKSVVLNLKDAEGMENFLKLIEKADVFITNVRPSSLKKLGIDHDTLCERYPHLIYALLTGYGEKGPDATKPGFDLAAFWSKSGFLADMSCRENSYPVNAPVGAGDTATGMALYGAILTALYKKQQTGKGDFVTVSLFNTALWIFGNVSMRAGDLYKVESQVSRKNSYPLAAVYRCKDMEWLQLSIMDEVRYAPAFFKILGLENLMEDERFNSEKARVQNASALLEIVEPVFLTKTCDEWLALFQAADIVSIRLSHFSETEKSEQAWANGYVKRVEFPCGDSCVIPCSPLRLASMGQPPEQAPACAPVLGADTEEVLSSLK